MNADGRTGESPRVKYLIVAVVFPVVLAADLYTKHLAVEHLRPMLSNPVPEQRYVTVIDGFFRLKYTENPGAAWGLLRWLDDGVRTPLFVVVALAAIVFLVWFLRQSPPEKRLLPVALAFILAGATGNLVDRLAGGTVVDFIDWYLTIGGKERHWPTFNLADAALTVGVAMILVDMLFLDRKGTTEK